MRREVALDVELADGLAEGLLDQPTPRFQRSRISGTPDRVRP
jgi:hypothetical protein